MVNVKEITKEEFEDRVIRSAKPVVVDFYAAWCGPCRALSPTVEKIAEKFQGELAVYKVNIDDQPDLAESFAVLSVPTLIFYKAGREYLRNTGTISKAKFSTLIWSLIDVNKEIVKS